MINTCCLVGDSASPLAGRRRDLTDVSGVSASGDFSDKYSHIQQLVPKSRYQDNQILDAFCRRRHVRRVGYHNNGMFTVQPKWAIDVLESI
jgi:hypothetical protein